MPGKIKEMIDKIIKLRSKGNPAIAEMTIAKLILKGINPSKFDSCSTDDPIVMNKLSKIAAQLNVNLSEYKKQSIKSAFSDKCSEEEVVSDIKRQLEDCEAKLLVFFASIRYDQHKLSKLLQKTFKNAEVVGCTTAGEIASGQLLKNSVVAMIITSEVISDEKIEVVESIRKNLSLERVFTSFEKHFNESLYAMDSSKYIGIVLVDGLSKKEERIMDLIGNRTNIFFVGGSAGDDRKFLKTYVSANGRAYSDSAVLIMLKINDNAEFGIIKTQSFKTLDKTLIANKVNEETREVIEFNNKPAICAYADAVGAKNIETAPKYFATNPVGLFVGKNEIFVRSPQRVKGTSMLFFCNILEGMEVRLLEATNIIEDTRKAIENKINEFGNIEGIINFDCIERILQLEKKNLGREYGEIFRNIPTAGFSTYGEEFIGHINQTSTMLVFRTR